MTSSLEMAAPRTFAKYEALGNDFVVIDDADAANLGPEDAMRLCDRHFGIGADGILVLTPPRTADAVARMEVLNSDGSRAEMCGNGLRCVVLHLARTRRARSGSIVVDTGHGPLTCRFDTDVDGDGGTVVVDMGPVRVAGGRTLDVAGRTFAFHVADAGNPHAVVFGEFDAATIATVGPRVATDASFPGGTNVEFARVAPDGIDLVVWERGAGLTLACGTGACATVAVACSLELAKDDVPVRVRLPGGALEVVRRSADGHAVMTGPARFVFRGELPARPR
ncbi:MAG: diaminopimelate epimerase [Polyangiaceae bacterium]